jgi:hypothetical protein
MQSKGRDIVSWVARTTPGSLDYIEAVHGVPAEAASIVVNVPMDPGSISGPKMLRRVLADNPTLASRVSLLRLAAAAGSEVARLYIDRSRETVKNGAVDLLREGKRRLSGWLRPPAPAAAPPTPAPASDKSDCATPARGPIAAGRLIRKVPTVRARVTAS